MARRRTAKEPDLDKVEFLGHEEADWALFWVAHDGYPERLYARKVGEDHITFGRTSCGYPIEEGQAGTPPRNGERTIHISALRRVIDSNTLPRVHGDSFINKTEDSVVFRTACGERRTVRLSVLRAIVEDAEALP